MTTGREPDWNGGGGRHTLAGLIAGLPDTIIVTRDGNAAGHVDAFLNRPVPRTIRGKTESRLFCSLSAGNMLVVGLDAETSRDLVARDCGEAVPGGVLLRLPTSDEELGTCWALIQKAHQTLSADSGNARFYRVPMLPNFSRTRLQ